MPNGPMNTRNLKNASMQSLW